MHVFMQMHKYSNIIVEGADFSFIILRFLSTGTILFIIIIIFFYYYFLRIFILFESAFIATLYYLRFILTYATCTYIYFIF